MANSSERGVNAQTANSSERGCKTFTLYHFACNTKISNNQENGKIRKNYLSKNRHFWSKIVFLSKKKIIFYFFALNDCFQYLE